MTRSRLLLAAGLAISALFLWLALRTLDVDQLQLALGRVNPWWALPFVACLTGFCWIKATRWSILLEPIARTKTSQLFPAVIIGYAGTTLMPMQLGEIARAYVAARTQRIRLASVLASIALERVLDVVALLCVLAIVLTLGAEVGSGFATVGLWLAALSAAALAVFALFAFRPELFLRMVSILMVPFPQRARALVVEHLQAAESGVAILRRPSRFAALILTSALQTSCMLGCCWVSLRALGIEVPAIAAPLILVTTLLGMSLPSGPGFVGTIQLAFWVALAQFDVSREDAIAASLFYHVLVCGPLLLGGVAYAVRLRLGWSELTSGAPVSESQPARERPESA